MTETWPEGAGQILHDILSGGEPEPGPPWTHTIVPPEPIGCGCPGECEGGPECLDDEGGPVYLDSLHGPAFPPQRGPDWQAAGHQ
jgi:hypothetical protein